MKKRLLLLSAVMGLTGLTFAQKLALYEEFSGENCAPCAAYNPGLMSLLFSPGNENKVVLVKYQSPIPSAGPIYGQNTSDVQNRMSYYSVNFAPMGLLNGTRVGSGANQGNIVLTTQGMIDAAALESTPFTIQVGTPTITGNQFSLPVTVTATSAASYNNLKLRVALIEDLNYATAPGTNGETEFHHVVRKMYPAPAGTAVQSSFTLGQSQSFTITGEIPGYVSAEQARSFVVWVQNDDNKEVLQAAKSGNLPAAANAISSEGITVANKIQCGSSATYNATVTIKNTGTTALTSAQIYYKAGNNAYQQQPWSGNLAPGATTTVNLSIPVSDLGAITLTDSVAMPNGQADAWPDNNVTATTVYLLNNDEKPLPQTHDFETLKPEWVGIGGNGGVPFFQANVATFLTSQIGGSGYDGSAAAITFPCYSIGSGATGFFALPKTAMPAGAKALDFYVAYCQYQNENDKLEVVYSTDCGATWTSLWSKQGAQLATRGASTSFFKPSSNSEWRKESVDVSNVPAGARIAFKATSAYGNNIYIDNVTLRTGSTTSINDLVNEGSISLYPSPASNELNVAIDMKQAAEVTFAVYNALGQEVMVEKQSLATGKQTATLNVSQLAAGVYILNIGNGEGAVQHKFIKE